MWKDSIVRRTIKGDIKVAVDITDTKISIARHVMEDAAEALIARIMLRFQTMSLNRNKKKSSSVKNDRDNIKS